MLFNHQHINHTNYQEAFLLYLDGELTAAETEAVEAFAAMHPHLQEELEMLAATKLPAEEVLFNAKESLLSQNIKANFIDDDLLLYIDGELNTQESVEVEKRLAADADYNQQAQLLQQAKLDSTVVEVYPFKNELYRSTEKVVPSIFWLRIAVAVLLVLGVSVFWFTGTNFNQTNTITAIEPAAKSTNNKPEILKKEVATTFIEKANDIAVTESPASAVTKKHRIVTAQKTFKKGGTQAAQRNNNLPNPQQAAQAIALANKPMEAEVNKAKRVPLIALAQQQIINTPAVTSGTPPAYNTIDNAAAADAGVSNAVTLHNNDKKGSVRGFLRKATRFIERRTGFNPVNEDEELLIGVVAIKL